MHRIDRRKEGCDNTSKSCCVSAEQENERVNYTRPCSACRRSMRAFSAFASSADKPRAIKRAATTSKTRDVKTLRHTETRVANTNWRTETRWIWITCVCMIRLLPQSRNVGMFSREFKPFAEQTKSKTHENDQGKRERHEHKTRWRNLHEPKQITKHYQADN